MAEPDAPTSGVWNGLLVAADGIAVTVKMTLRANDGKLTGEYSVADDILAIRKGLGSGEVTGTYGASGVVITFGDKVQASFSGTIRGFGPAAYQVLFGPVTSTEDGSETFVGICTMYNHTDILDVLANWDN